MGAVLTKLLTSSANVRKYILDTALADINARAKQVTNSPLEIWWSNDLLQRVSLFWFFIKDKLDSDYGDALSYLESMKHAKQPDDYSDQVWMMVHSLLCLRPHQPVAIALMCSESSECKDAVAEITEALKLAKDAKPVEDPDTFPDEHFFQSYTAVTQHVTPVPSTGGTSHVHMERKGVLYKMTVCNELTKGRGEPNAAGTRAPHITGADTALANFAIKHGEAVSGTAPAY
eukprot:GHVU01133804.1.p1 GENE.GHVU01133804.1~~GHVU01133804.1.p1  ORF type:complete len:231 (+),score=21.11 GHVU01133804.1:2-694(+)